MTMQISIAMCTYNGERYLREQLESISAQTLLPDELIVSDDGSSDRTVEIVRSFAATAPFSTTIIENALNLGYSRNFNQAVQRCSCEMIALADQDDIWYPEKLAVLHRRLSTDHTLGGIFSNGDLIDANSSPTGRGLWESFRFTPEDQARLNAEGAIDVLLRRNVVTGMAFAFRSEMKPTLTSVPPSWIHDGWLAMQIARSSRLSAEPARLVGYRVHGNQQVGAPASVRGKLQSIRRRGFRTFTQAVHDRNLDEYLRTARQYEDLLSFLRGENNARDRQLIEKVEKKLAYARLGAEALALPRHKRWPMLSGHIATYRRFSPTGLRGLLRDLSV